MNPHDSQIHFWIVLVVMGHEGTLIPVEVDRPAPGEELNTGAPTEPRPAATVIVLRGGDEPLEVLLVQRNPGARFMPGAWVFPGGALDGSEDARTAGVREVAEEAAVTLDDPGALIEFSRWITPPGVQIRFDSLFLLAPAPADADPQPDGGETVAAGWYAPQAALDAYERGELELVFPTIKTLEQLSRFGSAAELLDWAEGRVVEPVEPRVIVEGEVARIVLPGGPGYRAGVAHGRRTGADRRHRPRVPARLRPLARRRSRARHGAAAVRPGRARPAQDRVPAGRRARSRGGRRAGRRRRR